MVLAIIELVCWLVIAYSALYIYRNNKVYKIRMKWIKEGDERLFTYTYTYMLHPKLNNWFGFKIPKEEDYK